MEKEEDGGDGGLWGEEQRPRNEARRGSGWETKRGHKQIEEAVIGVWSDHRSNRKDPSGQECFREIRFGFDLGEVDNASGRWCCKDQEVRSDWDPERCFKDEAMRSNRDRIGSEFAMEIGIWKKGEKETAELGLGFCNKLSYHDNLEKANFCILITKQLH